MTADISKSRLRFNSGGLVLDRSGHVVAVVDSKLNALVTAKYTVDVPQNVNFAIKANIAMGFLDGPFDCGTDEVPEY
jgi:hypothetical protein